MTKFDDLNDAFNVESEVVPRKNKRDTEGRRSSILVQDVKEGTMNILVAICIQSLRKDKKH